MSDEVALHTRPFSVDDVYHMLASGILDEDEPLELLKGRLVVMSPQGPEHSYVVHLLCERLRTAYGQGFHVREEKPLLLATDSLPEPDLAVIQGECHDFVHQYPGAEATVLVVEVANTNSSRQRHKLALYAGAGIPEAWLLDLPGRLLEVHTTPRSDGYASSHRHKASELARLPGTDVSLKVGELLP